MSGRRLLTYIAVDTSGSMKGEPIVSVNVGLQNLIAALNTNPYALETVHLSVYTFDIAVKNVLPLTKIDKVQLNEISCPSSGATMMGECLLQLVEDVEKNRIFNSADKKGDWRPMLIILTDGKPSDIASFNKAIAEVKNLGFAKILACAAGPKADLTYLKKITPIVVSLDTLDSSAFLTFFEWVTQSIIGQSQNSVKNGENSFPAPPPEINVVL